MRTTIALLAAVTLSGCSVIFGVDDFTVGERADGGGIDASRDGGLDGSTRDDGGSDDGGSDDGGADDAGSDDAGSGDGGAADAGSDAGECTVAADCDDGDHCTADRCSLGACSYTPDTSCIGEITGGANFTCAMRDGRVYCWGQNSSGQLGIGTTTDETSANLIPGLVGVRAIQGGNIHACALLDTGGVACWGNNSSGQVGQGADPNQLTPFAVPDLGDVVQIGLGYRHTCALRGDGTVACWGRNTSGQLGDRVETGSATPLPVPGIAGAIELGVGNDHACVLLAGGTVRCWGARTNGRLGDGGATTGFSGASVAVAGITDAVTLAVGEFHSCVLRADDTMACWGGGSSGALGDDTVADSSLPTTVLAPSASAALTGVRQMALGSSHTCALTDAGEVLCWGSNAYGELTGSGGANRTRPTLVGAVTGAVFLGLGDDHSCALIGLGRDAVCWGRNRNGQLGDGTLTDATAPRTVLGI